MESSLHDSIRRSLEPGEDLIWSGRADPLRLAKARCFAALGGIILLALLPFSLIEATVAALVPLSSSYESGWPITVLLLFLALHLVLSPLRGYRAALRTTYVVTGRRLLSLCRTATGFETWSTSVRAIDATVLRLHPDGTGDIILRLKAFAGRDDERAAGLDRFRSVVNARAVHERILKALAESRAGSAAEPIRDYLELLIQGKRTLDERRRA